jgi:putative hydrolase of the HAD superfamily
VLEAVLFDVGGPLDMEVEHERLIDVHIREALAAEGCPVDDAAYAEAARWAVEVFAPNTYAAMAFRQLGGDAERTMRVGHAVSARAPERHIFELRPGIPELLAELKARGLKLGLAANQPASALGRLDAAGIGQLFDDRSLGGTIGFLKPDVRLFLHACRALGVEPARCAMVGDRVDNDVVPARQLGMRAVLFRTGRHAAQQPRDPRELPDAEVHDVAGLRAALLGMLDAVP